MNAQDVISEKRLWSVEQGDCIEWLDQLPADSVDLVFGSPPYEQARLYLENGHDKGIARDTESWVAWMVQVYRAALRVCRGLVAFVVEGQTRKFRYSTGPALLMADLHRAGVHLRKPPVFHRVGIPGSGGPDWLRNDWEWIICATRGGKLPWSDNTACGHPPKWAPGGEISHRTLNGERVNAGSKTMGELMHARGGNRRAVDGTRQKMGQKQHTKPKPNGTDEQQIYAPPVLANPGNVLPFIVGGGVMGHALAHENEAPFPLGLAEFFVRSFCPPGGVVLDPFAGSGTTCHAAINHGRRFVGCDLRESQVKLTQRRAEAVTPAMFS